MGAITVERPESYTPRVIYRPASGEHAYVEMLLELEVCGACERPMMPLEAERSKLWPGYFRLSMSSQAAKALWPFASAAKNKDDRRVCRDCAAAGKATFVCPMCGQERSAGDIKESFGDPPEHLCHPCFESVTAARWSAEVDRLEAEHRWDFE